MATDPLGRGFAAILVDMDGTILSSVAAAERAWTRWAVSRGIEPVSFLASIHGVQAVETIRRIGRSDLDPVVEAAAVTELEIADTDGVSSIAGAIDFLGSIPLDRWALVTSAPRALATRRMQAAGVPLPTTMVTAEEVARSKPAPDGFELAAARLGVKPSDCVVFEDSSAGVASGEAAGATVVVITAVQHRPLVTTNLAVRDFTGLRVLTSGNGQLRLVRATA